MIYLRGQLALPAESLRELRITQRPGRQQLQRDFPVVPRVERDIHLAHAATAETLDELVWADLVGHRSPLAGRGRHDARDDTATDPAQAAVVLRCLLDASRSRS